MTRIPAPSPFEQTCDCRCRVHDRRHRFAYNDPGCQCRITCASQPITLLTPQAAWFLNYHGDLWSAPAHAPDQWDWRHAAPVTADNTLYPATNAIEHLLRGAAAQLRHLHT